MNAILSASYLSLAAMYWSAGIALAAPAFETDGDAASIERLKMKHSAVADPSLLSTSAYEVTPRPNPWDDDDADVSRKQAGAFDLGVGIGRGLGKPVLDPPAPPDTGSGSPLVVRQNPDVNQDARIGFADLLLVLACYDQRHDPLLSGREFLECDFNDDGLVGFLDLLVILVWWTA